MTDRTCTPSPADLAYWAGLIDGEGHIGIRNNNNCTTYLSRFALRMSDRWIVEGFAADFGMKVSERAYQNALSRRPLHVTEAYGRTAAKILAELLPYLRLKRRQAELVIALEAEKRQPGLRTRAVGIYSLRSPHGGTMTRRRMRTAQEHLDRWHGYMLEVKALNRPGEEDELPARPARVVEVDDQDQVPVDPLLSLF